MTLAAMNRRISELIGMDIDEYIEADAREAESREAAKWDRVLKAVQLAPTQKICRALLLGERVPWQSLDYFAAERYGVRRGVDARDGRLALDDFNDVARA